MGRNGGAEDDAGALGGVEPNCPPVHTQVGPGGIATITLNSPANRNALSAALVTSLHEQLTEAARNEALRAVVLTHTGHVFCSGADLAEAVDGGMEEGTRRLLALLRQIAEVPRPVIARVDGAVRAGGLGIVAACDLAFATPGSSFALTEARIGLAPAVVSLTLLPRLEPRAASRFFLTGETFDGVEAEKIGLLTGCAEDLDAEMEPVLSGLKASSAQGLRETKRLLNAGLLASLRDGAEEMTRLSSRLFASDEARANMAGFLKRPRPGRRRGR
ncbi:enoyl-CoA hydratase family protein [Allostreptomyces psammosilenae]|uniref:Enoyl-CoA hydratase n=1 Tax=Allostreptomyces psammosilenae TaxID=1892865 RepID=A0A852ZY29_9ACTN|nr:enoyl-CoA hydratase family protein [Allostreptomyces psammosilenae]NYI07283.1 enoyl-CoA hydratase [Allostreptomyces psammosilenae]